MSLTPTSPAAPALPLQQPQPSVAGTAAGTWRALVEVTKPRLSLMATLTAILGYLAARPDAGLWSFLALCLGTAFAALGSAALNQVLERDVDARMHRTRGRPLPSGRLEAGTVLGFGLALSLGGCLLVLGTGSLAASLLTAATVALYLGVYTPLKRVSSFSTLVGAVPGALPPLIGYLAAGGAWSGLGWGLFAVLIAWQLPHFMAISWVCREDYARGGFRMVACDDPGGRLTARIALRWSLLLWLASLSPLVWMGLDRPVFAAVASALALLVLVPAIAFARAPEAEGRAMRLFFATLIYLPLYLFALVIAQLV